MSETLESRADFAPMFNGGHTEKGPRYTKDRYVVTDYRTREETPKGEYKANHPKGLLKEYITLTQGFDAYIRGLPIDIMVGQSKGVGTALYTFWWRAGWRMGRDIFPRTKKTYVELLLNSKDYKEDMEKYSKGNKSKLRWTT